MKDSRPTFLNLLAIRLPIAGWTSILHRVSGVFLFAASLYLLYLLTLSFGSAEDFKTLQQSLTSPWNSVLLWLTLSALAYHFVAGVRHLLMDLHIGESLRGGQIGSVLVLIVSVALAALCGVWLWL